MSKASPWKTSTKLTSQAVQRHLLVAHQFQVTGLPTGSDPQDSLAAGGWRAPLVWEPLVLIPQARYVSNTLLPLCTAHRGKMCQHVAVQILASGNQAVAAAAVAGSLARPV